MPNQSTSSLHLSFSISQVVELVGLTGGFLDGVAPDAVRSMLDEAAAALRRTAPELLDAIQHTGQLSEEQKAEVADSFRQLAAAAR